MLDDVDMHQLREVVGVDHFNVVEIAFLDRAILQCDGAVPFEKMKAARKLSGHHGRADFRRVMSALF